MILKNSKAARWEVLAPVELRNKPCCILGNLETEWFWILRPSGIHHLFPCTHNSIISKGIVQCSRLRRKWGQLGESFEVILDYKTMLVISLEWKCHRCFQIHNSFGAANCKYSGEPQMQKCAEIPVCATELQMLSVLVWGWIFSVDNSLKLLLMLNGC